MNKTTPLAVASSALSAAAGTALSQNMPRLAADLDNLSVRLGVPLEAQDEERLRSELHLVVGETNAEYARPLRVWEWALLALLVLAVIGPCVLGYMWLLGQL